MILQPKARTAPSGAGVALSCHGVSKSFPVSLDGQFLRVLLNRPYDGNAVHAVRDVSLSVPRGKILGILGRNGAGKSTLLRVLGGVYTPTSGEVRVEGSLTGLFELGGMGNRFLTGREYARRNLRLQGVPRTERHALVEEIHDFTELEAAVEDRIHTYSTGMAMRLYFAVATALAYDVYLIDELLAVGDEHFQAKCWLRLRERLTTGASGVLVTHDWSAVIKLCGQSCILERGSVVETGPSDRVVASYLDIKVPEPTVAHFAGLDEASFHARAGEDAELVFDVEILKSRPVLLGYSIELMRIGTGWEILLLGNKHPVGDAPGRYRVRLRIPRLPLAPGAYSLNLFLSGAGGPAGAAEQYDIRSWTVGRGLILQVDGESCEGAFVVPAEWEWA